MKKSLIFTLLIVLGSLSAQADIVHPYLDSTLEIKKIVGDSRVTTAFGFQAIQKIENIGLGNYSVIGDSCQLSVFVDWNNTGRGKEVVVTDVKEIKGCGGVGSGMTVGNQ